jgi:hypothetical protein
MAGEPVRDPPPGTDDKLQRDSAVQVLERDFEMFDTAAYGGKPDQLVSRSDLRAVRDGKVAGTTDEQRAAADYLLNHNGVFDALDTAENGGSTDGKIGQGDVSSFDDSKLTQGVSHNFDTLRSPDYQQTLETLAKPENFDALAHGDGTDGTISQEDLKQGVNSEDPEVSQACQYLLDHPEVFDMMDVAAASMTDRTGRPTAPPDGLIGKNDIETLSSERGQQAVQGMLAYGSFGLDTRSIALLSTLQARVQEKFPDLSPEQSAWMVNRIIGGFGYGGSGLGQFEWDSTAGDLGMWFTRPLELQGPEDLRSAEPMTQEEIMISLGYTADDYTWLNAQLKEQSDNAPSTGLSDLRHQAITTAANLHEHSFLDLSGMSRADLAGWMGDATHAAEATPSMGPDDYKADLDAVNIAALVSEQGLGYNEAANLYYNDLATGQYTRAEKFLEHVSYDKIEETILEDSGAFTLEELKAKSDLIGENPVGYWFLISLKQRSNELLQDQ